MCVNGLLFLSSSSPSSSFLFFLSVTDVLPRCLSTTVRGHRFVPMLSFVSLCLCKDIRVNQVQLYYTWHNISSFFLLPLPLKFSVRRCLLLRHSCQQRRTYESKQNSNKCRYFSVSLYFYTIGTLCPETCELKTSNQD
jgi:hypothetical protein